MKILVCTLADEPYWPLARISVPNKAAYAARHGYDFVYWSEKWIPEYPASMSKIFMINRYIEEDNYDYIFWTDVDSIIMTPQFSLDHFIDPRFHLIATSNEDGINTGQMLIKDSDWSLDLFSEVETKLEEYVNHPHWEQAALNALLGKGSEISPQPVYSEFSGKFGKPNELNRMVPSGPEHGYKEMLDKFYSVWKPNDFILHFAGIGGERAPIRKQLMEHFIKLVEQ